MRKEEKKVKQHMERRGSVRYIVWVAGDVPGGLCGAKERRRAQLPVRVRDGERTNTHTHTQQTV